MSKENTQKSNNKPQPPPKPPRLDNVYITESYSKDKIKNKERK